MITLLDSPPLNRLLVLYVLVISLARGIFLPDFRYDMISIVLIQIIYPVALFAPMIIKIHGNNYWSYYFLCIGGIVFATLLALIIYYVEAGKDNLGDQVSVAVMSLSFAAQIGLYSVLVILLFLANKTKLLS